jgi:hypothetical protein
VLIGKRFRYVLFQYTPLYYSFQCLEQKTGKSDWPVCLGFAVIRFAYLGRKITVISLILRGVYPLFIINL